MVSNFTFSERQPIIEEEQTDEDRIGLHDAVASKDATARARHFNLSAIVAVCICQFPIHCGD